MRSKLIRSKIEDTAQMEPLPPILDPLLKLYVEKGKGTFENIDLTEGCDKKAYLDVETFHNMPDLLKSTQITGSVHSICY